MIKNKKRECEAPRPLRAGLRKEEEGLCGFLFLEQQFESHTFLMRELFFETTTSMIRNVYGSASHIRRYPVHTV